MAKEIPELLDEPGFRLFLSRLVEFLATVAHQHLQSHALKGTKVLARVGDSRFGQPIGRVAWLASQAQRAPAKQTKHYSERREQAIENTRQDQTRNRPADRKGKHHPADVDLPNDGWHQEPGH